MGERESEQDRIISLLRGYPKGLTIDEVSRLLTISRPTAAKYLNNMVASGQADLRELGRAKLFYLTQRLPLMNLLSLASDLILILDSELFIREVNEPFLELVRLERDQLKGQKIEHSPVAPFFSSEHLAALNNALEGEASTFELPVGTGEGKYFFLVKIIPLVFEGGGHGAGILLEDITAMKRYQQELEEQVRLRTAALLKTNDALQKEIEDHKKTEAALVRNEARLRRAEEVAGFGNWEYRPATDRIILSDGARYLYGLEGREFPLSEVLHLILKEYHPLIRKSLEELTRENKPYNIEYKIQRETDGVVLSIHSIAEYDKKTGIIFGVYHDISGQKQAEEAVRRATRQIVLLNSVTRHDILNQLNALSMYLGYMKKLSGDGKMLELVRHEEGIADTIRRQITFTRDYQNIGLQPPQWTRVREMITNALATTDREGAALVVNTGTLELYSDLLIEKVYLNLVDNALRHGGGIRTITFSCQENDAGLLLVCEDDGQGIPDDEKTQIFERGFGKNTGYGLFLVKEILSITGFTIRECGVYGKGARFEISVPKGSYRFT